jgi:SpoVK/Ycf46/Vps4 family AAA+-type ATPase
MPGFKSSTDEIIADKLGNGVRTMNYKECVETLIQFTRARIPFIALKTTEYARALDAIREVRTRLQNDPERPVNLNFFVHSLSEGMIDLETERVVDSDKSIAGALNCAAEQMRRHENLNFVFTGVSDIDSSTDAARHLLDLSMFALKRSGVLIVLTHDNVWSLLQRSGMSLTLDPPDEEEMLVIIKNEVDTHQRNLREQKRPRMEIDWDEDDFKQAAAILAGATDVEVSNVMVSLITKGEITKADLNELKFVKNKLFSDINGLEKIDVPDDALEVGGLDGLKKWLDERGKLQEHAKREELRNMGLQPPRGILLVGVPGCGKSLSAKAIAKSWKLPLFRLDFATVQGQYVGQSENQLREAFQTAEHVSPCVLWVDEIEKGLSGGAGDGGVTTRLVGQFLFWMQECKKLVFVVATANKVGQEQLPPELLRRGRFDEIFFVDLPNEKERGDILRLYIEKYLKMNVTNEAMQSFISATEGFAGADLESSIRDVAYKKIAADSFMVNEEVILNQLKNVIPLSQQRPEEIEAIREWGRERAVPASGRPIGGADKDTQPTRGRQVL